MTAMSPVTKAARQAQIASILAHTRVRSQDELAGLLAQRGVRVAQATLSRDLEELGAVRLREAGGALVYALPDEPGGPGSRPGLATPAPQAGGPGSEGGIAGIAGPGGRPAAGGSGGGGSGGGEDAAGRGGGQLAGAGPGAGPDRRWPGDGAPGDSGVHRAGGVQRDLKVSPDIAVVSSDVVIAGAGHGPAGPAAGHRPDDVPAGVAAGGRRQERRARAGGGSAGGRSAGPLGPLARVSGELLVSAEASANLVVLRTPAGGAQLLASAIDHAGWDSILGTVAGDDTVLVIARDPAGGHEVANALLRMAERRPQ